MQAIVLVGGEGTRLRPLTLTRPKPALRLVDRPFIGFMADWLAAHGVEEVIMACGFRAELLRAALADREGRPRIVYLEEPEPLGTAGPLRLAADQGMLGERFLALNGDLLADLDLSELIRVHEERGATATLALHPVDDPSAYGLVRRAGDSSVEEFLEKPEAAQRAGGNGEIEGDEISAGAYVLEASVLDLVPAGRAVSIEREVFPRLVGKGLYGQRLEGYWMDIGTPERYLQASWDILERRVATPLAALLDSAGLLVEDGVGLDAAAHVAPPGLIENGCEIGAGARIGPRVVLGAGTRVGTGTSISESVLDGGCRIGEGATVRGALLAPAVEVGQGARVAVGAVIGEGARIAPGAKLERGARVQPGEEVPA